MLCWKRSPSPGARTRFARTSRQRAMLSWEMPPTLCLPGREHRQPNWRGSSCTHIAWNCGNTRIMNDVRLLPPWQMTLWHGWRLSCPKGWKYYMQEKQSAPNSGPYAKLSADEKKKRLDAMVRIWQSDTEKRIE